MLNWNINFEEASVYFKPYDLSTTDNSEICEKYGITSFPNSFVNLVHRKYSNQEEFTSSKFFLMKRLLQSGFPYGGTLLKINGTAVSTNATRSAFNKILNKPINKDIELNLPGNSPVIKKEISKIGKFIKMPVEHIVIKDTNEPFMDSNMFITDAWTQEDDYLPEPIQFVTAYAHINGIPKDWYTQVLLYVFDGQFHLLPFYIAANKTFIADENMERTIMLDIKNPAMFEMMAQGFLLTDPIWTLSEDLFDLHAPIWFNRFQGYIPTVMNKIAATKPGETSTLRIVSKPNNKDYSNVLPAYWLKHTKTGGLFNGYVYDNQDNSLIYGTFECTASENSYISNLIMVQYEVGIDEQMSFDTDIVYRPGFKEQRVNNYIYNKQEKIENRIDLSGVNAKFESEDVIQATTDDSE